MKLTSGVLTNQANLSVRGRRARLWLGGRKSRHPETHKGQPGRKRARVVENRKQEGKRPGRKGGRADGRWAAAVQGKAEVSLRRGTSYAQPAFADHRRPSRVRSKQATTHPTQSPSASSSRSVAREFMPHPVPLSHQSSFLSPSDPIYLLRRPVNSSAASLHCLTLAASKASIRRPSVSQSPLIFGNFFCNLNFCLPRFRRWPTASSSLQHLAVTLLPKTHRYPTATAVSARRGSPDTLTRTVPALSCMVRTISAPSTLLNPSDRQHRYSPPIAPDLPRYLSAQSYALPLMTSIRPSSSLSSAASRSALAIAREDLPPACPLPSHSRGYLLRFPAAICPASPSPPYLHTSALRLLPDLCGTSQCIRPPDVYAIIVDVLLPRGSAVRTWDGRPPATACTVPSCILAMRQDALFRTSSRRFLLVYVPLTVRSPPPCAR